MPVHGGPNTVETGLVLSLDAADRNSYVSGSTTWRDLAGNNLNGTLVNGTTFNTSSGGSIVFDGTNDSISLSASALLQNYCTNNTEVTFCSFVRKSSTSGSAGGYGMGAMLFSNNDGGWQPGWSIRLANNVDNNSIGFQIGFASSRNAVNYFAQPPSPIDDRWVHVAITHRVYNYASTCSIYLNGDLFFQSSSVAINNQLPSSAIHSPVIGWQGNTPWQQSNSQFQIGTYQIYNRYLSSQEILQNYNAQKSRFGL